MVELINEGVFYKNGELVADKNANFEEVEAGRKKTISYGIFSKHNHGSNDKELKIKFDALASHDITYVGIIQTARASGLKEFKVPYVLTNCHNSLCAVGGTINEDDHAFGLSAAKKYGGIFVPAHFAVIHQYMREMFAGCGKMIIGSDSHTRYGALGTMAVGEGGPELVKQLLGRYYEIKYPEVIAVYLTGKPRPGVGPQDVALALIGKVFKNGFVKNKVLEFIGPGVKNLSVDYRMGIDVMTTETTCLSSIWETDDKVKRFLEVHGRAGDYSELAPQEGAYYDGVVEVNLSEIECMIALPFHPSNVYTIKEFLTNAKEILAEVEKEGREQYGDKVMSYNLVDKVVNGKVMVDQGIVAGCSGGTYENVCAVTDIIKGKRVGAGGFNFSVYPASQPLYYELVNNGYIPELMLSGAVIRSAFCGPCFGAGDVPSHNGLSIRHTTRNFPNREGSKPSEGQISWVALMDARSIAATAVNGGVLTPATEVCTEEKEYEYKFNNMVYENRVYNGFGKPMPEHELRFGPNIADWPKMQQLGENILLEVASVITDPVTTTDELIPSGETSSFRSNPLRLAEFTLSRKDPNYVGRAKQIQALEKARLNSEYDKLDAVFSGIGDAKELAPVTQIGSVVYAVKPGDGSAREQAASCQKVLGGYANIACAYATKRYRSNLINWGILPFTTLNGEHVEFNVGDRIFIKGIRKAVEDGSEQVNAKVYGIDGVRDINLCLNDLSDNEREILLSGCLINYYNIQED
jgi:aconitate hydratase